MQKPQAVHIQAFLVRMYDRWARIEIKKSMSAGRASWLSRAESVTQRNPRLPGNLKVPTAVGSSDLGRSELGFLAGAVPNMEDVHPA
jgi:hypothetical protein